MISATMKACQEYSSFAIDPSNRDISDAHIDRLEEAVADVYLLDAYPIVTTAERVIIDGQHRFRMAKSLGIPFYFISGDGISVDDIAMTNANTEKYKIEDAAEVYDKIGLEPYRYLSDFSSRYRGYFRGGYSKFPCQYLADSLYTKFNTSDFMNGDYGIDRVAYTASVLDKIMDFAKFQRWIPGSVAYRRAIGGLAVNPVYDHKRMIDRLSRVPGRLMPCGRLDEALTMITEVYNFNLREDRRIDLSIQPKAKLPFSEMVLVENNCPVPQRGIVKSDSICVYEESDLSKFSVHPSCRSTRKVDSLAESISERNLLKFYPIIVDRNFVVHDGCRRLEAAKRLGVSIHYIVVQNISMWMVARAGGISKAWGLYDHAKHNSVKKIQPYMHMFDMKQRYRFLCWDSFITLHEYPYRNTVRLKFKSGMYEFSQDFFMDLVDFLSAIPFAIARSSIFQAAIADLYRKNRTRAFLKRMGQIINNTEDYSVFVRGDRSSADYRKLLIDMYNTGLPSSSRINFD